APQMALPQRRPACRKSLRRGPIGTSTTQAARRPWLRASRVPVGRLLSAFQPDLLKTTPSQCLAEERSIRALKREREDLRGSLPSDRYRRQRDRAPHSASAYPHARPSRTEYF